MALQINKNLNNILSLIGPAVAMKASLFISLIFHITILLIFQNAFPFYWNNSGLRTYRVDLIRPPVEDIDTGDSPRDLIDHTEEKESPITDTFQDTISLDTKDKRYISYASLIKKEIMTHWRYPTEALANLIEGKLTVIFSLASDGKMTYINITEASGHEILDKEVIHAINSSVPFPPFPESITVKRLNIKASFDYRLSSEE
jgi:TonB family protein